MKCRICGCGEINYVRLKASHPRRHEVGKEYSYYFCSSCGCLQEVVFPEDYSKIYDAKYFLTKSNLKSIIWNKYMKYAINKKGLLGQVISYVYKPMDYSFVNLVNKNDRILDVGCGNGAFIRDLYLCGYGNLTGCDPFLSEEIVLEGVRLLKKEVYDIRDCRFKLITLINVFEHLEEPERVMKKLSELVEDDGYIVILLPVINSFLWEKFGTSIWNLSPPEHLYIHTYQSMMILAERAGLTLCKWYTECSSILWADKRNMDKNQQEKNNSRDLLHSAWYAISSKKYRVLIDEEKKGNQGVFVFKKRN